MTSDIGILPGHRSTTTLPERWFSTITGEEFAMMPVQVAAGGEGTERWLPVAAYEATLATLVAENAARAVSWEPDTPEQAADRAEITEALFGEQAAVMTRGHDD